MKRLSCLLLLAAALVAQSGCDDVLEDFNLDFGFCGRPGYSGYCWSGPCYEESYVEEHWYEETRYEDSWYEDSWYGDDWYFWPW